ncbi:SCAN domain-containing protein 3 [Araneus ventricosus]|uniref:SCAN domain-containing protein 3 n=1 Tax=Araneus ventricosus TaxID=182803 RepID=A0A4Y2LZD0_ARAVE|nr:SCAN domain-containing protein 3 [Araneus ventricosus]
MSMNCNTASVSEVEDGTTQESLYSEVSKLRLKDAVIYYQGLLAQNNLISSESSASISHEAMLMGEEIFQNTLAILAEKIMTLARILGETEPEHSFSQLVHDPLSLLLKEFERYFPTTKDPRTGKEWICDPFVNKSGESSMSVQEEDQLLEIANDDGLKTTFETTTLPVFWIKVMLEYPEIANRALKSLLPFPTTYLREEGFSVVTANKTK